MFKTRESTVPNCEKKFLIQCLSEHTRLDGRAFDEFRDIKIDFGKDWGCCLVSLGQTKVLAQVSCEIQQPKSSRPSEGILNINVELGPMAAPHFEAGRQSDISVQLNRILEKCLKDSKAVDLESLCIKMNEKVWALRADINVLNHEGNVLDCASVAALVALMHFRRPDVTFDGEEFVIHEFAQRDPIPTVMHHYPICITYSIYESGEYILADPSLLEENIADAYLTISLNGYKELCGLHLGGKTELTSNIILKTVSKASSRTIKIIQQIKDTVEANNKLREQKENIVGFYDLGSIEEQLPSNQNFEHFLDQWKSRCEKRKNMFEYQNKGYFDDMGKGSAAYISPVLEGTDEINDEWHHSSDDNEFDNDDADTDDNQNDVMVIEPPNEKEVETVQINDSSSEEDVIILNEDKN